MFRHRNQHKNHGKHKAKSGGPDANTHAPVRGFQSGANSSHHNGSNTASNVAPAVRRDVVSFPHKIKLILSQEFLSAVMFMHQKIKNVEWSGPIWYEVVSGEFGANYKDLVLRIKHFYPMDIGTSGYTEYDMNEDTSVVDAFEKNPELLDLRMGHCHSHHNMACFFSGTDMQELHDNTSGYDYYLSIIVNHAGTYMAKVAFVGRQESNVVYIKGQDDDKKKMGGSDQEVLGVIDCDIVWEESASQIAYKEAFEALSQMEKAIIAEREATIPNLVKERYDELLQKGNKRYNHNQSYARTGEVSRTPARTDDFNYGSSTGRYFFPFYAKQFLSKIMMQSYQTMEDYDKILIRKNGQLYDYATNALDPKKLDKYTDDMANIFGDYFERFFGVPSTKESWQKVCDMMIDILGEHPQNELAEELIDLFEVWRTGPAEEDEAPGTVDLDKEEAGKETESDKDYERRIAEAYGNDDMPTHWY